MTIERSPHPVFSLLWLAWFANVLGALAAPHHPLYGLVVLIAFLPIEGTAVFTRTAGNMRDTWSEIFTWLQRHLAHDRDFARGWNAMLLLILLSVTYLLGRTVAHYSESVVLGAVFFTLATIWLHDHLWHPDKRG